MNRLPTPGPSACRPIVTYWLQEPWPLERNNDRLPLYHRLDFSWTIHNFKRKNTAWTADWVFTVYSLYGRANAYNVFCQPRDASTPPLGLFSGSPFEAYRLSICGAPVFSLVYKFTWKPGKKRFPGSLVVLCGTRL